MKKTEKTTAKILAAKMHKRHRAGKPQHEKELARIGADFLDNKETKETKGEASEIER